MNEFKLKRRALADRHPESADEIRALEAEVEKLRGFKLGVYRLLVEGIGPGGGYYREDQRLGAAVALLQVGWAS